MKKYNKSNIKIIEKKDLIKEESELFDSNDIIVYQNKTLQKKKNNKEKYVFCKVIFPILFIIENILLLTYLIIKQKFKKIHVETVEEKLISKSSSIKILEKEEALNIALPFVKYCVDGKLIKNRVFKKVENPRISIILPCYNCGPNLIIPLRSIQNQDMTDIEIIIVNDNSDNKTVTVINELKEEDPRIEVYNNDKNMGLLYTRSIGVIKARGKYVIILETDDNFCDSDIFYSLYITAEEGNFDIISYNIFEAHDYYDRNQIEDYINNYKEKNLTVYQPELSCFSFTVNKEDKKNDINGTNDINISGKLIRTSVYKSAINLLGEEKLLSNISYNNDFIIFFIIQNIASSFRYIPKYSLFHYNRNNSYYSKLNYDEKALSYLTRIEVELDLCKRECYNIPAIFLIQIKDNVYNTNEDKNKNLLKKIVKRIIYSVNIDEKYKNEVQKIFNDYDIKKLN